MAEAAEPLDAELDDRDHDYHNGKGEVPDGHAIQALHLAHRAVDKFPDLKKRYHAIRREDAYYAVLKQWGKEKSN